jgi:hypothetical protein
MNTQTLADVRVAIKALERRSRDKAVEILRQFGVMRTPELKPEQYQAVIDLANLESAKLDAWGPHEQTK